MTLDQLLRTNHVRAYQLAKAIGYTPQAISLWRVKKRYPTHEARSLICKYFDVIEGDIEW